MFHVFKCVLFTTSAIVAAFVPMASGAQVPRYDVDTYCESVASAGGDSSVIRTGCIEIEQGSYYELNRIWVGLSSKQKNYCHEVAEVGGGSYSILKDCIEMESEASTAPAKFKY